MSREPSPSGVRRGYSKGNQFPFDDRLAEIDCGEFEGTEETADNFKLFWRAISDGSRGTESFKAFMARNCDFCDMIMENYQDKNILIVTHAANTRVIDYYFDGKPASCDFSKTPVQPGGLLTYALPPLPRQR